jgi:ABC-type polar amino acid transport system ATPase subunit
MTMVIVTHEIDFARSVSDRVIFMADGLVVEQGAPADVIDNPNNERTKAFLRKMSEE